MLHLFLFSRQINPNYPPSPSKSTPWFCLILMDSVRYMYSPANRACSHVYQIHQTPPAAFGGFRTVYSQAMDALHLLLVYCTKSIKLHRLLLLDSGLCIAKPWMLCICYCTNSIKLHRLLLLDSGLCIAKPWMLCICYCTNSIKLHRLLLLDSGLCIAKPWMLCICYCTNSIKLHRLLLLDSGLCIANPWMLCICYCTNSIKVLQLGDV